MSNIGFQRNFAASALVALLTLSAVPSLARDDDARDDDRCCEPTGRDFPMVGGNLGNTRYSKLDDIDTESIKKLGGAWHVNLEGGALVRNQQSTPIVVDGVMYVQTAQQDVFALNAATGKIKWKYAAGGDTFNMRGVAVGGGLVFSTLSNKRVVALNKETGALVWQTTVAADAFGTGGGGVAINPGDVNPGALNASGSTPTAITYHDGLIYFGTGGGDGGFRGRFYALKAATGDVAWAFYTTPSPGGLGSDTWEGNSWATGGAAPWMHGALDPELGLFYFTAGQPWPVTNGSTRGGDNLFASSLIAVDAKTGEYRWHYQMSHHDLWDYDMVVAPVLFDVKKDGESRKAIAVAGKTGFFYIFDRTNGQPLVGIDEFPVPQDPRQKTSPTQPIPRGDAFVPQCTNAIAPANDSTRPVPNYLAGCLYAPFWDRPTIAAPGTGGGADWGYSSFNPKTRLLYVSAGLINSAFVKDSSDVGGGLSFFRPLGENKSGMIAAMNPTTNTVVWKKRMKWSLAHNHLLTTAGNVIFVGQPDGYLVALDARNGEELWRFQTGAGVHTGPITYEVGGEQYVAVLAGGNGLPYNSPAGDHLWAFKLHGTLAEVAVPTPPSVRQPINAAAVAGSAVGNTVTMGRVWDTTTSPPGPGTTESLSQNAMSPQNLVVPVGTTVTFFNPPTNTKRHCATQFFEGLFNISLEPGQTEAYTFSHPGEYFYNDCTQPQTTGKVVVQ